MFHNRLVVGIHNSALSQRLQLDAGLTLEKAKTNVRQREAVGEHQKLLNKGTGTSETHSLDERQHRDGRKQWKGSRLERNNTFCKTPTQSKQCQTVEGPNTLVTSAQPGRQCVICATRKANIEHSASRKTCPKLRAQMTWMLPIWTLSHPASDQPG